MVAEQLIVALSISVRIIIITISVIPSARQPLHCHEYVTLILLEVDIGGSTVHISVTRSPTTYVVVFGVAVILTLYASPLPLCPFTPTQQNEVDITVSTYLVILSAYTDEVP